MAVNGVIQSLAALMSTCRRHVSSAARRLTSSAARRSFDSRAYLFRRVISNIPFVAQGKKRLTSGGCWTGGGVSRNSMRRISEDENSMRRISEDEDEDENDEEEVWRRTILMGEKCQPPDDDDEKEVWRRTILMGEKCQPLEFSGAIYYDSKGRRAEAPPRSPLKRPLPSDIKKKK